MLEKYWSFIPEETPEKWQHLLRGLSVDLVLAQMKPETNEIQAKMMLFCVYITLLVWSYKALEPHRLSSYLSVKLLLKTHKDIL